MYKYLLTTITFLMINKSMACCGDNYNYFIKNAQAGGCTTKEEINCKLRFQKSLNTELDNLIREIPILTANNFELLKRMDVRNNVKHLLIEKKTEITLLADKFKDLYIKYLFNNASWRVVQKQLSELSKIDVSQVNPRVLSVFFINFSNSLEQIVRTLPILPKNDLLLQVDFERLAFELQNYISVFGLGYVPMLNQRGSPQSQQPEGMR